MVLQERSCVPGGDLQQLGAARAIKRPVLGASRALGEICVLERGKMVCGRV